MQSNRFVDLMRGATLDETAFRQDLRAITPADRCYVVLFSARSGSSWLTSLLSATDRLGQPHEYLNPNFVAGIACSLNAGTPRRLLHMLIRHNKSPNGVFGIEARASDIQSLSTEAFRGVLADRAVFFHLWRDNLVAQAVSLYRAIATERYHSTSTKGTAEPPPYDPARIQTWLHHVAGTENENAGMLQHLGVGARHLRYEDIVADRAATLQLFARVLGRDLPPDAIAAPAPGELTKIGDDWNAAAEARFRAENPEVVQATEAARAVKHGLPKTTSAVQATVRTAETTALQAAWQAGREAGVAGQCPFDPPAGLPPPQQAAWREGWEAGWDDQPAAVPVVSQPVLAPPPALPPEAPGTLLRPVRDNMPRPLHDYTALRLTELLDDQARRGILGGLLEIGLSRGRQTLMLVKAQRGPQTRVVGLDLDDGRLTLALRAFLANELGPHLWTANDTPLDDFSAPQLRQILGGPARFIGIDGTQAPDRLDEALAVADALVDPDGCVAISDFLSPTALYVSEAVFRFLAASPNIAPFALLPGRLLLAPAASHPRYLEMMKAFALRDRTSPISVRLHDALARGEGGRLEQTLFGHEVIALG